MSESRSSNLPASVRDRLLLISKGKGEDFNLTLTRYGIERLLYRLSQSAYSDRFVLKGATLFAVWLKQSHRPTRDLDLLGYVDNEVATLREQFQVICRHDVVDDGLQFDADSIRIEPIRELDDYGGQRVHIRAFLAGARINLQIDVGFGDAIVPPATEIEYPTLLGFPSPRLRAYPPETVIAEKLHAIVALGWANSRIKDFYDVWVLSSHLSFDGAVLTRAIGATFERRQTTLPSEVPLALTEAFSTDSDKTTLWRGFLDRNRLDADQASLSEVIIDLQRFLVPPLAALAAGRQFAVEWNDGGPWRGKAEGKGRDGSAE